MYLFFAKDVRHAHGRKIQTEGVRVRESPNNLSEPVDISTQNLPRSKTRLALLNYISLYVRVLDTSAGEWDLRSATNGRRRVVKTRTR